MVKIEENKIIIEIKSPCPLKALRKIEGSLVNDGCYMEYPELGRDVIVPILGLIAEMKPECKQPDKVQDGESVLPEDTFIKKLAAGIDIPEVYELLDTVIFEWIDQKMTNGEFGEFIAGQVYGLKMIRDAFAEFRQVDNP